MVKLASNTQTKEALLKLYKELIRKISKVLDCLKLQELFIEENIEDILSTAIAIYYTISNQDFMEEDELRGLALIEKCIVQFGKDKFTKEEKSIKMTLLIFMVIA